MPPVNVAGEFDTGGTGQRIGFAGGWDSPIKEVETMREFDRTVRYEAMHHFTIAISEGEIHGLVFVGADNASLQEGLSVLATNRKHTTNGAVPASYQAVEVGTFGGRSDSGPCPPLPLCVIVVQVTPVRATNTPRLFRCGTSVSGRTGARGPGRVCAAVSHQPSLAPPI